MTKLHSHESPKDAILGYPLGPMPYEWHLRYCWLSNDIQLLIRQGVACASVEAKPHRTLNGRISETIWQTVLPCESNFAYAQSRALTSFLRWFDRCLPADHLTAYTLLNEGVIKRCHPLFFFKNRAFVGLRFFWAKPPISFKYGCSASLLRVLERLSFTEFSEVFMIWAISLIGLLS